MLSNDQVFKPCTKSCKPNRPIPLAKRYSTKSTPFISSSRFTTYNCLCSLVSNPDHTSYYGRLLRVCTADNNLQGHAVAVFGRQ